MWPLIPAIVLPLVFNLWLRRRDVRRRRDMARTQESIPSGDPIFTNPPLVSFLVAAWNEESRLLPCLQSILGAGYPNCQLVLCAGGTDKTWELASQLHDERLILFEQNPGDGKWKSFARCLEKTTGEIIVLLDADCLVSKEALARLLRPIFVREEDAVTSIPCLPVARQMNSPFALSQLSCRLYTSAFQPAYCSGLSGANSAIRRSVLKQAGGFDVDQFYGGDYDLGKRVLRLGTRIRHEFGASFHIEFQTRPVPYLHQQARWLRNVVIIGTGFRAYGEVIASLSTSLIALGMFLLPFLAAALAVSAATAPLAHGLAALWLFAFLHACLSRLRYWRFASDWLGLRFPWRPTLLLPLFLLLDFAAWTLPLGQYPVKRFRSW